MVWSIHRARRHRPLNANRPQLVTLTEGDAKMLRYGAGYFGGLKAFTFQCPGPCEALHEIRPGQRRRYFDPQTQRFRCPSCGIELQLSILAEILPPRLSKQAGRAGRKRREPARVQPTTRSGWTTMLSASSKRRLPFVLRHEFVYPPVEG